MVEDPPGVEAINPTPEPTAADPEVEPASAGQNLNTDMRLSEEFGPTVPAIYTQPLTQQEDEVDPRLSVKTEPEIFTQPTPLSERLSEDLHSAEVPTEAAECNTSPAECKTEVIEPPSVPAKLSTQSEGPLSTQPKRMLSTQSWAGLGAQRDENGEQTGGRLSTQPFTQPKGEKVVNLADFRSQSFTQSAVEFEASKHKKSRVKSGQLIVRIPGYSIAEDEYGVCYLKVLSRKPDRTSGDCTKYPYAGFFKWSTLEEMGLLIKEKQNARAGRKSGKHRAGGSA